MTISTQPKERPILFSAPMVRAILEGRKTVTRREVKKRPALDCLAAGFEPAFLALPGNADLCPYGQRGDRLWVRESHAQVFEVDIPDGRPVGPIGTAGSPGRPDWKCRYVYRADGEMPNVQWHHVGDSQPVRWTPSIHMRREASRILLEITDVRVERLQGITEAQAVAEGVRPMRDGSDTWVSREGHGNLVTPWPTAKEAFGDLWNSINGPHAWEANPWVWCVNFQRVTP